MKDSHESYLTSFYTIKAFHVLPVVHTLCHCTIKCRNMQDMYTMELMGFSIFTTVYSVFLIYKICIYNYSKYVVVFSLSDTT